jgi:PIN domain nuclease of toxin-antitoxin system
MRILVDTHAFFWWVRKEQYLPPSVLSALEDLANTVFVSPVVAWEMATKGRLGKWPEAGPAMHQLDEWIDVGRLEPLPITIAHAALAGSFATPHRDPFDRLLAAQARSEDLSLATADPSFRQFKIDILW